MCSSPDRVDLIASRSIVVVSAFPVATVHCADV
jgi:hypothetical protein